MAQGVTVEAAILLAQAGEFAFIVIALGRIARLLSPLNLRRGDGGGWHQHDTYAVPRDRRPRDRGGTDCADRASRPHAAWHHHAGHTDHVIIGGYGRVGQVIGRLLEAENVPFVALDTNAELASEGSQRSETVFFGDAARREFLRRAGAAGARAFVVTVNSPRARPNAWSRRRIRSARTCRCSPAPAIPRMPRGCSSSAPSG